MMIIISPLEWQLNSCDKAAGNHYDKRNAQIIAIIASQRT